jgi:hypothetical protein
LSPFGTLCLEILREESGIWAFKVTRKWSEQAFREPFGDCYCGNMLV